MTMLTAALLVATATLASDSPALEAFRESFPGVAVDTIAPAPFPGWQELVTAGGEVVYLSSDGRFVLNGDLLDLRAGGNLTEQRRAERRASLLAGVAPTFRFPADEEQARVVIVTDVDCPYCRRLHQDMAVYNDRGISVDYLLLARGGLTSPAGERLISAACADDPAQALTRAMAGETLRPASCSQALANEAAIARQLRTTGTPAVILPDGTLIDGYLTPDQLAARLGM